MKLFSRVAFICNVSFIIFIILQYIEFNSKKNLRGDNIMPLPFLTGTLVILGATRNFYQYCFLHDRSVAATFE
jgi:hypothetical protein